MEGSFTEDPEGCVKNGSGKGRLSTWGPRWGTRGDPALPGILREK